MKIYQHDASHMTKKAAMLIYGKNPLTPPPPPGTSRPISRKLGVYHLGLRPIIVCSNYEPVLTLTYFMARSNFRIGFYMGKCDNDGFFGNYCSL